MMLQILVHHLIGDLSGAPYAIADAPKMPASVASLERRVFLQELTRRATFDAAYNLADRMLRRVGKMQMHMIATDHSFDDLHVKGIADLPQEVTAPLLDLSAQHAVAVLRAEDQMDLESIDAMATSTLLHARNLLKVSC